MLAMMLAGAPPAGAQQSLDDALKGFEDTPSAPPSGKGAASPFDRDLEGFDEPAGKTQSKPGETKASEPFLPPWLRLGGGISQDISYNYAHDAPRGGETDHRGLSGLRSRVDLEADIRFSRDWRARLAGYGFYDWAYRINGRDNYTEQFLDEYESDADLGDAYIQGKLLSKLDVKLGRQVVVWGKSDNIRITDVLNPLDIRLPGRTDIEDLRLLVTMTKVDAYFGKWNLAAIAIHEIRFNKAPVFGSDFFTAPGPPPPEDEPEEGFDDREYAVALNGTFSGWDLSLYGAYIFDDLPHAETTPGGLRLRHSRLRMGGMAANIALGNWLLKGEAAYFDGIEFLAAPGETFSRLDALAGVEYSGFRDTTISFEAANRHLFGFDNRTEAPPDDARRNDFQTAIRVTQKYFNDTLEVTVLASTFGPKGQNGGFQRFQAVYDWTDSVEIMGGVINYMSGDTQRFSGIGGNDRLFARIKYRF